MAHNIAVYAQIPNLLDVSFEIDGFFLMVQLPFDYFTKNVDNFFMFHPILKYKK